MLDKSIPYHDMVMACDGWEPQRGFATPEGYTIRPYRDGDEVHWAAIETSVGEFSSVEKAMERWNNEYLPQIEMVRRRCLFAIGPDGQYLGTCTAWEVFEPEVKFMIHWVAVKPEAQGLGLGGALVSRAMELFAQAGTFPVALHTQTWSHKAIRLYHKLGFYPLRTCPEKWGKPRYAEAMAVLKTIYTPELYSSLESAARDYSDQEVLL